METEYLDEEEVIALYNKVRTGKRTWPADIWSSPAALQYAVTVFDYWIHNVMGWKGWPDVRLVRRTGGRQGEAWSIVNADDERRGEGTMVWGEPHPYCLVVLDPEIEAGTWEQVIYRLEQEILVEEPGVVSYAVWHKGFVGEFYRCADCSELHSQFDEDAGSELRLNDLEPPEDP